MTRLLFLGILLLLSCTTSNTQTSPEPEPTILSKTLGMEKYTGFFNFYWDYKEGKIWLEVDKLDFEFLYINSLSAGVGSNDLGLDRGQLGQNRVVKFIRHGPKIFLVQLNYSYRAESDNESERKAVTEAFAQSILWGFDIAIQEDLSLLVDATAFFLNDARNVSHILAQSNEGHYELDPSRSAIYLDRTRNFPNNSEFESLLTFVGQPEGPYLPTVVPSPEAVTIRQHHSFVQLPDDKYQPRKFDSRSGYISNSYMDYAKPVTEPIVQRQIMRHRLLKKDLSAKESEPLEPIIYYLDPGTPEPIRSALLDGARWWDQAFQAIGYKDAFRVEMLPEDADPLDIRYNVIQWVHRSTRGWSYGMSVSDPRTGEIIKGHVSLGSLRVRQDYLIAQGLLSPFEGDSQSSPQALALALARLRQLSAHEVGHTLGLVHNYAASYNDRASVMDYPHPKITIDSQGDLDVSDAYDVGIGEWDKVTIAYGYQDFADGVDEAAELEKVILGAQRRGLKFITDADARPQGGAHPTAHLWDNGTDAAMELDLVMTVRARALENFSENNVPVGIPLAELARVLVPVYFFHRYQLEAATKLVGGVDYAYSIRGDGQHGPTIVSAEIQNRALNSVLQTVTPQNLAIPTGLLELIPPSPPGYEPDRESFRARTGPTLDPMGAAEGAADLTMGLLLNPEKANRLVELQARDSGNPGLHDLIDRIIEVSWGQGGPPGGYLGEIQWVVNDRVVYHLMKLSASELITDRVRAIVVSKIHEIRNITQSRSFSGTDEILTSRRYFYQQKIDRFLEDPDRFADTPSLNVPPGSPIGSYGLIGCGWYE